MERETIGLAEIVIDDKLNVRDGLDNDTIERYMDCFDYLPPVVAFDIDEGYLLADGFHRVEAAKRLGREEIEAEVKEGTKQDAEEWAAMANLTHGKPLTRAERRKAVERKIKLHPERANNWIAQDMGVSENTVKKYREELEAGSQIANLNYFVGKDGKKYPRKDAPHSKKDEQPPDEATEQPQEAEVIEEPERTAPIEPEPQQAEPPQEATERETEPQEMTVIDAQPQETEATSPQPEHTPAEEPQLYCDERFVSLDDIRGYIGKTVEVTISVGKGGPNIQKRGVILEQEGAFMLETEDGKKQQLPTGMTTGAPTDEGIVEIKVIEPQNAENRQEQPQEPEAPEIDEDIDEIPFDFLKREKDKEAESPTKKQTYWEKAGYATKEEYDTDYACLMDDKEEEDEEEAEATTEAIESKEEISDAETITKVASIPRSGDGWETFVTHAEWIEDYSFKLASQEDIDTVRRILMSLEHLARKLRDALEELEELGEES